MAVAKKSTVGVKATAEVAVSLSKAASAIDAAVTSVNKVLGSAVEGLEDKLIDLSEKIAEKEDVLVGIDIAITEKKRAANLDFELRLKEDQETVIYDILGGKNKVAVDESEYIDLQAKVESIPKLIQDAVSAAEGKAYGIAKSGYSKDVELLNANFKAQEASNIAEIKNLTQQVLVYKEQSAMLQKQIELEREASVKKAASSAIGTVQIGETTSSRR